MRPDYLRTVTAAIAAVVVLSEEDGCGCYI